MHNNSNEFEFYVYDYYDRFARKLTDLLDDHESTASINAASPAFSGTDPYAELENLKTYLYDYRRMAASGVKDPALEGSIGALEDYFSELIGEPVVFDLSK